MAYSSSVSIGSSDYRAYRGYISASISNSADTTATVSYSFSVQMKYAYQYGVAAECYVDGTKVKTISGYLSSDPGSSWKTVCSGSGTKSVTKKGSSYSITVKCKAYGKEVSGYGSAGGSTTVSVTLTVPARTRTAHGPPTFSVDKSIVATGESVTLTVSPSATQGNANFDHFEISDGMGNKFFISDSTTTAATVTTTDVPSAVLETYGAEEYLAGATGALDQFEALRPNCVYYAAREVHEWYDTYPASEWVWVEVEVNNPIPTITIYDSSGIPRAGIVTVYDAEGNAKSGTVIVYDTNGIARQTTTQ